MRLYGHSQHLTAAMPLIEATRPAYWKWVGNDSAEDVDSARRCAELGVRLIIRHYGEWDKGEPEKVVTPAAFVAYCRAQPWWPYAWAVETPNEPHPGDAQWMSECVGIFAAFGKHCVVGNWGTGWDGMYAPGAVLYSSHEYGYPSILSQQPWHATRCFGWFGEVVKRTPDAQLFLTEVGVTQAVEGRQDIGWHTGPLDAFAYWEKLIEYNRSLEASGLPILGAFLYQVGGYPDWHTFETLGTPVEDLLREHLAQHTAEPIPWMDEEQETTMPKFVLGFADVAARLGPDVVGEPEADERSLHDRDGSVVLAVQPTTKGVMLYVPGGSPAFLPKV